MENESDYLESLDKVVEGWLKNFRKKIRELNKEKRKLKLEELIKKQQDVGKI